jgi:hypothetical protein
METGSAALGALNFWRLSQRRKRNRPSRRSTPKWRACSARRRCNSSRRGARGRTRESARQALRGFIDRIVIPPGDELLQVVGNLGEMLTTAAGDRIGAAAVGYVGCGGTQPAVLAAVVRGSVRLPRNGPAVKMLAIRLASRNPCARSHRTRRNPFSLMLLQHELLILVAVPVGWLILRCGETVVLHGHYK